MEKAMQQLPETYYKRFAEKSNWDSVIADDFQYTGSYMTKTEPLKKDLNFGSTFALILTAGQNHQRNEKATKTTYR